MLKQLFQNTGEVSVRYGRCHSDFKSGEAPAFIDLLLNLDSPPRTGRYKKKTKKFVQKTLSELGLPYPKQKELFVGRKQNLLFLDSHGIVIRIGPTDVSALLNPTFLQPLGWINAPDNSPISIVLYSGISLFKDLQTKDDRDDLQCLSSIFGNYNSDVIRENLGVISSQTGKFISVMLDLDNETNWVEEIKTRNKRHEKLYDGSSSNLFSMRMKQILWQEIAEQIEIEKNQEKPSSPSLSIIENEMAFKRAFEYHQPLRNAFSMAVKDGKIDPVRIQKFWTMAKNWKEKGYSFYSNKGFVEKRRLVAPWNKFYKTVRETPEKITNIPTEERTTEMYMMAVRKDASLLSKIPFDVEGRLEIEKSAFLGLVARVGAIKKYVKDFTILYGEYGDDLFRSRQKVYKDLFGKKSPAKASGFHPK